MHPFTLNSKLTMFRLSRTESSAKIMSSTDEEQTSICQIYSAPCGEMSVFQQLSNKSTNLEGIGALVEVVTVLVLTFGATVALTRLKGGHTLIIVEQCIKAPVY